MQHTEVHTGVLEALLFHHGEPIRTARAAEILGVSRQAIDAMLAALEHRYEVEDSGLMLLLSHDTAQLVTKPSSAHVFRKLAEEELGEALTPAALETLSLIAYLGPVSRPEIDYVRGVNSSFVVRSLLVRGLVERIPDPARAHVHTYRPTFDFLKHVGVRRVEDLPEYAHHRELLSKIRERKEG